MTEKELIRLVVKYCKSHSEIYNTEQFPNSIKLQDTDHYFVGITPNNPDGLLPKSKLHKDMVIDFWVNNIERDLGINK